jgi:hypothetical protein
MADGTEENEAAPARPAASTVPRDKPVIEGHAEEIASQAPQESSDEIPPEDPWDALPGPATAEVMPLTEPAAESVPEQETSEQAASGQASRAALWPFAAAIVVAALLLVGGAFGLHLIDRTPADLASLETRVAALEQRPNPAQNLAAAQADLSARLSALETASSDTKTALAGLRAEIDKLAAQRPASGAAPDLAPLEARVGAFDQKVAALDSNVSALTQTLDAEKGQVRATESRVSQSAAASSDNEAIAILAASLLREVESGAPYGANLAALANRGLDNAKLAPLEDAAGTGVATPAALAKQFSDLTPAILATEPQPKENGFLDHLVKGAERLVRVEKIGDISGDDLESHAARVQAALDSGAVDAAYQEWSALPDEAKAKSVAIGAAAKARIDAIAAARSIDAEAVAALGKARS